MAWHSKWLPLSMEFAELPRCNWWETIRRPHNAGSLFYDYKGFHSIVLMAIADSNYRFISIDVGAYGSECDAGVFAESSMGRAILNNSLRLPQNAKIGSNECPFYFVADDAFPLKERIMKPYTKTKNKPLTETETIFNYRLRRARRCIENAFGILCARFQCLSRMMFCAPDRAQKIISAVCHLHNYLMHVSDSQYCVPNFADSYNERGDLVEGQWRLLISTLSAIQMRKSDRHCDAAKYMRDSLKDYVNSA